MIKGRVYASIAILTILFLVGSVLMGFEMLGSRYLNPYFGSGITTWACLISVVLLAMMAGYFTGGTLVDRWPRLELFSAACLLAGISLGIIPLTVDPVLEDILATVGDGFWGAILGAMWISFIPVALLSACSPFAVRLLLVDLKGGGMTAGLVYSVSTFGNVIGILATTFWLIPLFGVRTINFGFAVFMLLLGVTTLALCKKVPALLAARAVALVVLSGPAIGGLFVHGAGAQGAARMLPALYPEGPIWQEDRLFYTEMGKDTVSIAGPSSVYPFWREPGCGPTAISVFGSEDYIVLCHIGRKLVRLSKDGRKLGEYLTGADKKPFQDPNDVTSDGAGGVFFSDSGAFKSDAPSTGRVYHLAPDGKVTLLVERLHYANGIAFDAGARLLYVSEHLAHKVWEFSVGKTLQIQSKRVILDVSRQLRDWGIEYPETGPDGIEIRNDGSLLIAIYGAGRVIALEKGKPPRVLRVPMKFVTNMAATPEKVAVVGSYVNDRLPLTGEVQIWDRKNFDKALMSATR